MAVESDGEALLTTPAKEAIRSYMIKLVTLPAIAIALISFVIGFGINEIARGQAYTAAFQRYAGSFESAFKTIIDAAAQVGGAKDSSDRVAAELRSLREQVKKTIDEIDSSKGQVDQILKTNISGIADAIGQNPELKASIIRVENSQLASLVDQVRAVENAATRLRLDLRSELRVWGNESSTARPSGPRFQVHSSFHPPVPKASTPLACPPWGQRTTRAMGA